MRLKEIKDNLKDIVDLGNTANKEEEKRIKVYYYKLTTFDSLF